MAIVILVAAVTAAVVSVAVLFAVRAWERRPAAQRELMRRLQASQLESSALFVQLGRLAAEDSVRARAAQNLEH